MELEPAARAAYVLGGDATVTLVSKATGVAFTYQVRQHESVHYVRVLTGPDNEADYEFLGTIFHGDRWGHGTKSRLGRETESAKAWSWFMRNMHSTAVEVYHSGKCGRCGRKLTTPESIKRGLGPTCTKRS